MSKLTDFLPKYATTTDIEGKEDKINRGAVNGYAPLGATKLVPVVNLGTGVANNTTYLRGDGTWGASSINWEDIVDAPPVATVEHTHQIPDVIGLAAALAAKAPLDGVGTSGVWPISITGNAVTVTSGVYLTATQTITNKTLTKPIIDGLIETAITMPANNIAVDTGAVFIKTITAATTLTVSGAPPAGKVASFILKLTNGGSKVVTWWAGIKWGAGTAPVLTAAGKDNLGFYTNDAGATWEGFLLSTDSK